MLASDFGSILLNKAEAGPESQGDSHVFLSDF